MQKRFSLNENIIKSFRGYFILTHSHSACIFKLYADYIRTIRTMLKVIAASSYNVAAYITLDYSDSRTSIALYS